MDTKSGGVQALWDLISPLQWTRAASSHAAQDHPEPAHLVCNDRHMAALVYSCMQALASSSCLLRRLFPAVLLIVVVLVVPPHHIGQLQETVDCRRHTVNHQAQIIANGVALLAADVFFTDVTSAPDTAASGKGRLLSLKG